MQFSYVTQRHLRNIRAPYMMSGVCGWYNQVMYGIPQAFSDHRAVVDTASDVHYLATLLCAVVDLHTQAYCDRP